MLTGDLVRPRLRKRGSKLLIDTIDENDAHWLRTASELIALFGAQIGQPYKAWIAALDMYEGDRVDYIVVRGFAKVLSDAATFTPLDMPPVPADLRHRLFALGPVF